jgi:hypothetical protein
MKSRFAAVKTGAAGEGRERHCRARAGPAREASYVATTSKDIDLK